MKSRSLNRAGLFILVFTIAQPFTIVAYESSMINMSTPSGLEPRESELSLQHRFGRAIGKKSGSSFFDGANVDIGYRFQFPLNLEVSVDYMTGDNDISIGASYSRWFLKKWVSGCIGVSYFNFDAAPDQRGGNLFYILAVQSAMIAKRTTLTINQSLDGYNLHASTTGGVLIRLVESLELIGEYTFSHDSDRAKYNTFSSGFKFNTYGHHFKVMVTNCQEIGPRRATAGAGSNALRFGFSIQRAFMN